MSDIYLNGHKYGPEKEQLLVAAYANRGLADVDGENINATYLLDPNDKIANTKALQKNPGSGAASHNGIFMGRDITDRFESGDVYKCIEDGSFKDLFIGDFFIKEINEKEYTCRLAGFDMYMNAVNPYPHHAVIVVDEHFGECKMNDTNTTEGGYKGSKLRTEFIPQVNTWLTTAFTSDHLVTLKDWLTTEVDGTIQSPGYRGWMMASSAWEETDSIAELMTEIEVYGTRVWSSSGYDVGIGKTQLPLFALSPQYINPGRFSWWLRGITSTTFFCHVGSHGIANCDYASSSWHYVRPRWCIC